MHATLHAPSPRPATTTAAAPVRADSSAALPLHAALTAIGFGVSVYDDASTLVYANAAAQATLFARAADEQSDAAARRRLSEARAAGLRGERRLVERASWEGSTFSAVVPVVAGGRTWIVVLDGRGRACGPLELQLFCAQYRLTYAESKVLHELSMGLRAADIATARGVALTTVLTQILSIRSKTVAASLRDLLNNVARLPPLSPQPLQLVPPHFE